MRIHLFIRLETLVANNIARSVRNKLWESVNSYTAPNLVATTWRDIVEGTQVIEIDVQVPVTEKLNEYDFKSKVK